MNHYEPIEVAIAISLYAYNVSPGLRMQKLYDHFKGDCMEPHELLEILTERGAYAATELPYPTAAVYIQHALEKYGKEAQQRRIANERAFVPF